MIDVVKQNTDSGKLLCSLKPDECIAIVNNRGGNVYFHSNVGFQDLLGYSIRAEGSLRHGGKFYKAYSTDVQNSLKSATKYAFFNIGEKLNESMFKEVEQVEQPESVKEIIADFEKQFQKLKKEKSEKKAKQILNNMQSSYNSWRNSWKDENQKNDGNYFKYQELVYMTNLTMLAAEQAYKEKFSS